MQLGEQTLELFLAVVPAFIASLPPRQEASSAQTDAERRAFLEDQNASRFFGVQVRLLPKIIPQDLAKRDLPEAKYAEATQAFDNILYALGNLLVSSSGQTGPYLTVRGAVVDQWLAG